MNNRVVANINSHMTAVADDIAGLCFRQADAVSAAPKRCGTVRKSYAEVRVHAHDKSGTVCPVGQAGTAIYIRITYKL